MRKFALVILDLEDKVTDRYNLDIVTQPTGLGFKLNMSTLSGDIEDVITKVSQAKNVIKFTVNQYQNSYSKANSLALWVQKYSKPEYTMALEYDDGNMVRYCEGRVTSLGKTELDMTKVLPQEFEFTQTTPFFIKRENTITIQVSSIGKSYPHTYPYSYGRNEIQNNEINNEYIFDIPLIIRIDGAISTTTTADGNIWGIELVDKNGNSSMPKEMVAFTENLSTDYYKRFKVVNNANYTMHIKSISYTELLTGNVINISADDISKIKSYTINAIESREANFDLPTTLKISADIPPDVEIISDFNNFSDDELKKFLAEKILR